MIIYCSMMMKYTSLLLLSVLSVLFVPIIQNAHAQSNPLDQLIGGIKNLTSGAGKASNNTASQAGQSAQNATSQAGQSAQKAGQSAQKAGQSAQNATSQAGQSANQSAQKAGQSAQNATSQAGQSANQSAQKAGQSFQDINRNAASYPGNASDAGNNNISKNNPIGGALQNATKGIGDTVGKLLNMGNNTAK